MRQALPMHRSLLFNLVAGLLIAFPVLYALLMSLMSPAQMYETGIQWIPAPIHWANYAEALRMVPLLHFFANSVFVSAAITLLQLAIGIAAAFAFAFFRFRGKSALFYLILSSMMIPAQSIVLANFTTISRLDLMDTYLALILPAAASAFTIFNLRQSFMHQPAELREAASMDGCTDFKFMTRIVVPVNRAMISSCAMIGFIFSWNDYLWPLLVTNDEKKRTIQIGISMMHDTYSTTYGPIMAAVTITLLPSIVIVYMGQKQLVSGLAAGAVKG
ncbi:carbohydrate ABC transporter permease [Cohnella ginsengisoli]|uniref:Carbohydrate ABC transporter permease n=1 Tax=Cohnella ginsengisoli TaxID=425004 RepID=A0A9X4QPD4_9BACL|nr:carbohydrate ABC transporter permease [Cohnella ginsengisoli]MDG0792620.1 carbohydrate ABC transporter permease [Cohnella ginsengisoli]